MSIRLRLSILYSVILALTLLVFGSGLYAVLSYTTRVTVQNTLVAEAQELLASGQVHLDSATWQRSKFAASPLYAQTCATDGQVIERTPNLQTLDVRLPLDADKLASIKRGKPEFKEVEVGGFELLVYSTPITQRGVVVGVLQVAQPLTQQHQALGVLRSALLSGGSIATLIAFGSGWVLAGTALRPITKITQTARAIGTERDFGRRVTHTGPKDEVGRLATTFNGMLTELQGAYAQVEHALQVQRRFIADASHELRTPLTTLRGNLGLLQRQPPISQRDRDAALNDMVDETERMSRLVNDLLTLARTDAGRVLRNEPAPLPPLLDDVCRNARSLGTGQTITCESSPDAIVCGDEDALKQVVLILVDNALKYTPPEGAVRITANTLQREVAISVGDTGPGIEPALLPHLFERFRRGNEVRSGTGTGLGLAIAKTLTEAQGGTISVESEVGQGSTFTVRLPRASSGRA